MPFGLQVITPSGGTYSLSAGTPYSLEGASGMWMAPIRRVTEQGPMLDGDTDRGFRLDPRISTLSLNFVATSGSALDTYRDTLMSIFRPTTSTPLKLRLTRDDGGVRQLDVHTVGPVDVPLERQNKPGNLHRAVVQLRAADPGWYDSTPGTVTVTGTASLSATWYTADGLIGSANVMEYGENAGVKQAWTYTGTPDAYTILFRSTPVTPGTIPYCAYVVDNNGSGSAEVNDAYFGINATNSVFEFNGLYLPSALNSALFSGTTTLFAQGTGNYGQLLVVTPYFGATFDVIPVARGNSTSSPLGSARYWRTNATMGTTDVWPGSILLYAVYDKLLSSSEMAALNAYANRTIGGSVAQVLQIPYLGDFPEYPTIQITGPITSPVITNTATGKKLSFGTVTIGSGSTYVINLAYAQKTVLSGTVSKLDELTADSDLETWALVPGPIAPGGTNTIQVTGSVTGVNTRVRIIYYNRYAGY